VLPWLPILPAFGRDGVWDAGHSGKRAPHCFNVKFPDDTWCEAFFNMLVFPMHTFCGNGVWTQGLALVRQMLCHVN
jgi:hypothetical protein